MNKETVLALLGKLGLRGDFERTGHPDYDRIYIMQPPPDNEGNITLGRVCMYQGQYSHIKWYTGATSMAPLQWEYLLQTGTILSPATYANVLERAKVLAQADRDRKLAWRRNNPKFKRDGTPANRPALAPPNSAKYIWPLLMEDWQRGRSTTQPELVPL